MKLAQAACGVSFVARPGTYRYLDMDVTIREALDAARGHIDCIDRDVPAAAFFTAPL